MSNISFVMFSHTSKLTKGDSSYSHIFTFLVKVPKTFDFHHREPIHPLCCPSYCFEQKAEKHYSTVFIAWGLSALFLLFLFMDAQTFH